MENKLDIDRRVFLLAEAQHGVIARSQLLEAGLGPRAIVSRLRAGRLIAIHRGVYALGHRALKPEGWWLAAVLAFGNRAVLSHRTAARLWGLRPASGSVEVTVRSHGGRKARAGITVHRSVDLRDGEITVERAIPVTTPARTLLDLAAVVRPHELRRAVERSEQLELFDLRDVRRVLEVHAQRRGAPALRALLDDLQANDVTLTRSDVEALVLQICLDRDLPRPQVNRWDGEREVDFRWPDHRLVVEIDGWQAHRSREAFERDRDRSQVLALDGLDLVRFTARQVQRQHALVATRLAALLALRDREPPPPARAA